MTTAQMTGGTQNKLTLHAAFLAIYVVWGTTYLAIKVAVETIPPFMMMGMRSLSAGLVLYTWGRLRGDANVTRHELPSIVLIGILFFLVGHGVLAWCQKTVPSGVAALLVAAEPIVIALLEPLATREGKISRRTLLGMLIGVAGITVLVVPKGFDFENANLLGSFGILFAASSWASGAVYARVARLPRSPMITGGLQLIVGGMFLILASFLLGEWSGFAFSQVMFRSWLGLAYLLTFGSIITFSAYTWLLTVTSATRISTHTFVNPIVAMLVGWALGGEALTWAILIATVLIVVSVWLILIRKTTVPVDPVEEAAGEP